ncbi:MAG: hypothetical protein JNM33_12465 [Rubrivivax sp.]|nr:hypothetical protein [Rubrivivax sp.]
MSTWLDADGRFFSAQPQVQVLPLAPGRHCVVVDNALAHPQGLRDWACAQAFQPPVGYPYPGVVCDVPDVMSARLADFFAQHVRSHLGARRTLELSTRLSVISTPPASLAPIQWLCHRDRFLNERSEILFLACVLYLFPDAGFGGTSFYRPRLPPAETEQLVNDSQTLPADLFSARYGLQPGYMNGSNAFFERVAQVPAAWNRIIFYDGSLFHSADVGEAALMTPDAQHGRLTLNSFITCRRAAR